MNKQSRIQSRNKGIKSVVFIGIFTTLSIYLWRLLSKEENHIHIPHPHSLPTSFHPHRFLPLLTLKGEDGQDLLKLDRNAQVFFYQHNEA